MGNQNGSSMVEVMVALFVLAIGLLGMLAMQTKSMQYNQSAYTYAQAAYLANDMVERIRTNRTVGASYNAGAAKDNDCTTNACTPDQLLEKDLFQVNENVSNYLPGGTITLTPQTELSTGANYLRVTVSFKDDRTNDLNVASTPDTQYSLMVEI